VSSNETENRRKAPKGSVTDRVQPNWQRPQTLESAGFPAFGWAALPETLSGTGLVAAKSIDRAIDLKLGVGPIGGFLSLSRHDLSGGSRDGPDDTADTGEDEDGKDVPGVAVWLDQGE
jgi:hypothetical protein